MKQTARIISTYSADPFGVCSALYELGGMTIMHDPSGCNSTYTTHDEPRWFDQESMVYISGLTEMEAIMGDDQKLVRDIVSAAGDLHPAFIAIAGTPIPMMTGFDFQAVAHQIEAETGIPAFGFATSGMGTYIAGASMAWEAIVRRFALRDIPQTEQPSANILGLTPLDFSVNGQDRSIRAFLEKAGFSVNACFAMGSELSELCRAGAAHVNVVVSASGLGAARALQEQFGTPYVTGIPIAGAYAERLADRLWAAVRRETRPEQETINGNIVVIGEGIRSRSLAEALELTTGRGTRVICAVDCPKELLRGQDVLAMDEDEIIPQLNNAEVVIADPLYRPICPEGAKFVSLPHEAFSGRIYRKAIPDLAMDMDFEGIKNEVQ